MAKKGKAKSAKIEIDENESGAFDSKSLMVLSSSEDEEANEDLSLKIVEKAILVKAARFDDRNHDAADDPGVVSVVNLTSSSSLGGSGVAGTGGGSEEADLDLKSKKSVKRKKKKTIVEKVTITGDGDKAAMMEKVETVEEAILDEAAKPVESLHPNTVDKSDNIVLRKLLRGARYFDPPDSGWETCYNCGEEGHMAVKSASKRKKPCFLCGSLDHGARQCSKAQDCFICKKSGHRAKDCPNKHNSGIKYGNICLRCGASGHDMFSCRNDYSHDDIKEIQCYICKSFGHLCCVDFVDTKAREVSCYRCGQMGHNGLSCGRSHRETKETTDNRSPSLCYKCGEGGHFARECATGTPSSSSCYKCGGGHYARECSSAKVGKRNREPSTPNRRPRRENKEYLGYKSAPHDQGKILKRKKNKFEENGFSTPRKEKQRGGWITEEVGDFSNRKSSSRSHWSSPKTPPAERRKKSSSVSRSSKTKDSHRYSASRFSNFGNDEPRRVYNWW